MSNEQIKALQDSIVSSRQNVDMADALRRLQSNRDFKKVIQEGYFEKEAIRLVHLKADPAMQTPDKQASILRDIDAIGTLHSYFALILRFGDMSKKDIAEAEAEIEAIEQSE
jgi:hypothetical protein